MPPTPPLQIVICDGSAAFARALRELIECDPSMQVAGVFTSAEEMLPQLDRLAPDLIVLDLELGGMGGPAGIRRIMDEHPRPIVVLSPDGEPTGGLAEALAAGALETIAKTTLRLPGADDVWATALRSRLRRLASLHLAGRPRAGRVGRAPAPARGVSQADRPVRAIGIGASTGGPNALLRVLGALPADFHLPVLVVQHIAPSFAPGLIRWLDGLVPLPVAFAQDGVPASPGIWFAPEGVHLRLGGTMRFALGSEPDAGPHRPSLDALLGSMATVCGSSALGVVLTGMGRDGAEGVEALRRAGGLVIAQDEASSTVFGMPRAAIESGANRVMDLDDIGPALAHLHVAGAAA